MKKSITSMQEKQYKRFVEDAAEKALEQVDPDKDELQTLFSQGGEFQSEIVRLVKKYSVSQKFADEKVESSYGYPSGYTRKDIVPQTNLLRQHFPGIGFVDQDLLKKIQSGEMKLPKVAEGWFAIPRWEKFAPTYGEALKLVLAKLGETRKFYNCRAGHLGPDRLRQHPRTAHAMDVIGGDQKGDILVVPAQFGLRHRGRNVRRVREVIKNSNEFGLDSFAIACMLLTHPERLVQWEQLHVDCAGDEYDYNTGGLFSYAPIFNWNDGETWFDTNWCDNAYACYGAASGFLPKSSLKSKNIRFYGGIFIYGRITK